MTIMRKRHPFEGQSLSVVASMHRGGVLLVLVVLPNGERVLVPVDWTDLNATDQSKLMKVSPPIEDTGDLARLADLLRLRKIIDALQNRLTESATPLEGNHAATQADTPRSKRSTVTVVSTVASDECADTSRSACTSRASHRPQARKRTCQKRTGQTGRTPADRNQKNRSKGDGQ